MTLNSVLRPLGAAGVVALGVLCFDAALLFSGVLPRREQLMQAEAQLRLAQTQPEPIAHAAVARDPLERLFAVFPKPAQVPDAMARLFQLAEQHQLQLLQGDYRKERLGASLQAYRISLPLKGSYPQLRAFIAGALNTMPYLALDSIRFERQLIGDASVEALINFSLFMIGSDLGDAGVQLSK